MSTTSKRWLALFAVLVLATCLRPAITAVGPLLPQISADLGLGEEALGLLGSIPLLCFAAGSPLVHLVTRRLGERATIACSLAGIALGIGLRSLPVPGAVWLGTIAIGLAIAVGNVAISALVKRDFAARVTLATGLYTATMGISASLASGWATPLSTALGGWRASLLVWAAPTVLALVLWWVLSASAQGTQPASAVSSAGVSPWRSGRAWWITGFFGVQSLVFYLLVTWLPSAAQSFGQSAANAGWLLFWFQLVGVASGPAATAFAQRVGNHPAVYTATGVTMAAAMLAIPLAPGLLGLWIALAGIAAGASFPLGLALPPLHASNPAETARLAGMAQAVGYLIAAIGPILAGWLAAATSWSVVLVGVAGFAVIQAVLGWFAARSDSPRSGLLGEAVSH